MCILIYFLDDISTDMNLDLNIMVPSYPSPVCIKITDTVSSMELLSCSPSSIYLTVKLWCVLYLHCKHVICECDITPKYRSIAYRNLLCPSKFTKHKTMEHHSKWAMLSTGWHPGVRAVCGVCPAAAPTRLETPALVTAPTRTRQASASPAPGNRALGNAFVRRVTSLARKRKYPNQVQYWSASFQNQDVARRNPVSSWADRRQGWAVLTSWVRWTFW